MYRQKFVKYPKNMAPINFAECRDLSLPPWCLTTVLKNVTIIPCVKK